jgi:N-acetylglucosaminyl-diphospho-decaprenol L-rhamnosyltransferase
MTPSLDTGKAKIAIVIPVFNQLHYTRQCVASLNRVGVADAQMIIVNNASTDGTAEFLAAHPEIRVVSNETNVGCGPAWTQGARLSSAEWTVVLNNDVLIPTGCLEGLISFAVENKYDVVCPAMREGEADYDWQSHAAELMKKMKDVRREDIAHGVCFMVHRKVFETIGYFNNFGGYEDDDFFRRARQAGFRLAITGRAFLHHFGSVTQKGMKCRGVMSRERRLRYRKAIGQTWLKRKIHQLNQSLRGRRWKQSELRRYGNTLRERRMGGVVEHD